ncbi:MAG: ABC transporter permease [Candidatus Hodarchaeales archaeon]
MNNKIIIKVCIIFILTFGILTQFPFNDTIPFQSPESKQKVTQGTTTSIYVQVFDSEGAPSSNTSIWLYKEIIKETGQYKYQLASYPAITSSQGNITMPIILSGTDYYLIARKTGANSLVNISSQKIVLNQSKILNFTLTLNEFHQVSLTGPFWLTTTPQIEYQTLEIDLDYLVLDFPVFGTPLDESEFQNLLFLPITNDYSLQIKIYGTQDELPYLEMTYHWNEIQDLITELNFSISALSIRASIETIGQYQQKVMLDLLELERLGYYTLIYNEKMDQIILELGYAVSNFDEGNYELAHFYMRNTYLNLQSLEESLSYVNRISQDNVFLLWSIFGLFSLILAWFFSERITQLLALYIIFHTSLTIFLYFFFPAMRTLSTNDLLIFPLLVLSIVYLFSLVITNMLKEGHSEGPQIFSALISSFLLAKRNLKRRRLRSGLTTVSIAIMIFAFIALTSFNTRPQIAHQNLPTTGVNNGLDGIMIRNVDFSVEYTSTTVPFSDFSTLRSETSIPPSLGLSIAHVSERWENKPVWDGFGTASSADRSNLFNVSGVMAFSFQDEEAFYNFSEIIIEGHIPVHSDEALLPSNLKTLGYTINKSLLVTDSEQMTFGVKISGFFDESKYVKATDIDGNLMRPQVISQSELGPITLVADVNKLVFITIDKAELLPIMQLNRININLGDGSPSDYRFLGDYYVVSFGFEAWLNLGSSIVRYYYGDVVIVQGVESIVLILIVSGLTIANVMYRRILERKREIYTLNAVGLNPANITFIFLGESLLIGILSGVIGYILGISSYTVFLALNIPLLVVPKIEVIWAIAAMSLSIFTAVISSVIPSYQSAKAISSMHSRKWSKDKKVSPIREEGVFSYLIPIRIHHTMTDKFLKYMGEVFSSEDVEKMTFQEREVQIFEKDTIDTYKERIMYDLRVSKKGHSRAYPLECELFLTKTSAYFYEMHVTCCYPVKFGKPPRGYEALVELVVSHIRKQVLIWDTKTQPIVSKN